MKSIRFQNALILVWMIHSCIMFFCFVFYWIRSFCVNETSLWLCKPDFSNHRLSIPCPCKLAFRSDSSAIWNPMNWWIERSPFLTLSFSIICFTWMWKKRSVTTFIATYSNASTEKIDLARCLKSRWTQNLTITFLIPIPASIF